MLPVIRSLATLIAACYLVIGAASAQEPASFPITIEHAFGTTIIEKKPVRVATVAWANHEVPLALGIVPVGFARANFGDDDDDGLLPWVASRLKELGAQTPVLFDESDGIDFEAVAAAKPDVILAGYSGLSQEDYDLLSRIAPVVPYREAPWSTDWRDMIRLNSAGLGMPAEGEALIGRIEKEISTAVAAHPDLAGKTALFVTHLNQFDLGTINFYTANDTRVKFFDDLGLLSPQSVIEASEAGKFSGSVSAERIDAFDDIDLVVTYGDDQLLAALMANPLMAKMRAVSSGAIVILGRDPLGTAANPTPLSIGFVLESYLDKLSEAAKKSR